MERSELNTLWEQLMQNIAVKSKSSKKTALGFLSTAAPVEFNDDMQLTIAVKTDFSKDYIERHYGDMLCDSLLNTLGFQCTIKYVTNPQFVDSYTEPNSDIDVDDIFDAQHVEQHIGETAQEDTAQHDPAPVQDVIITSSHDNPKAEVTPHGEINVGPQIDMLPNQTNSENELNNGRIMNTDATYNPKFTFDNYVVGESNRFARAAAVKAAEEPGKIYNPLFIYGSAGLGKTHLLNAIANYVINLFNYMRVIYVTSEDFVRDVVASARNNLWDEFTLKYRSADVLLIDDVQFLEDKESSISQLFSIFNVLTNNKSQIVLSADRPPKDLDMDERMRSRFLSGINVEITMPSPEMQKAILQNYLVREVDANGLYIPDDALDYIVSISNTNIRELEGAIAQVVAYMNIYNKSYIELDDVKSVLHDFFPVRGAAVVDIATIQDVIEHQYDVSHADLIGPSRAAHIIEARQIGMYLSRLMTDKSFPEIGRQFNRDHSTIMHGVDKIENAVCRDEELYKQIEFLRSLIGERVNNP